MKYIPMEKLYQMEYSSVVYSAFRQYWRTQNSFSCIGTPKERNNLLYLDGCQAEYTLKDGTQQYAQSGDLIYTPVGTEYQVRFYGFETEESHTVGIQFMLYEQDEPFIFKEGVYIFRTPPLACKEAFISAQRYGESVVPCPAMLKSAVYDILSSLSLDSHKEDLRHKSYHMISTGISYLENNPSQEKSIAEIARMCNVSEVYFRRMFKQYAGISPVEYRMNNKIARAQSYLAYEDLTVTEISDLLGFTSPAYFSKQFRARTGKTPLEYREATRSE